MERLRQTIPLNSFRWLLTRWGLISLGASAYVFLYGCWLYFQWGGATLAQSLVHSGLFPLAFLVLFVSWRVYVDGQLTLAVRRGWFFFSAAIFMQVVGYIVQLYEEQILFLPLPFFVSDILFLSFFPLAFWSLLTLSGGTPTKHDWLKFFLDFIAIMITAWMMVWYFLIVPATLAHNVLTQVIAVVYPISNLVVLGEVLLLLAQGRRQPLSTRASLIILLSGLLFFVGANLMDTYYAVRDTHQLQNWYNGAWACAYLLFLFAAIRQRLPPLPSAPDSPLWRLVDLIPLLFPFVSIGIGYGLLIYVARTTLSFSDQLQGVVGGAALLTILIVARQILDLRDNIRLNTELRAFSQELEHRVLERTRELENSQEALLASEKMAIIGTLAAGVAHEISNPLSAIRTSTEFLQNELAQGTLDLETAKEASAVVLRSADHALQIAQAVRNQSRGQNIELQPHPFAEVLREALMLMSGQIKRWNKTKVLTEIEEALPAVKCDRNQIAQVVFNLMNNAHDALPAGGTITLLAYQQGQKVLVEVKDTGSGIAPENLEKLFKPFFTTKPIGKGSGLGLSIVRAIVEDHGGKIEVKSAGLGKGTTFVVTLPVAG